MARETFAVGEKLKGYIEEIYETCSNPNKDEKCKMYDTPADIPCQCPHLTDVRKQLKLIIDNEKY